MEQEQRIRTKSSFEAFFFRKRFILELPFPLSLHSVIMHINTAPNANIAHLIEKQQLFSSQF